MSQISIVPDVNKLEEYIEFAKENNLGFEYDDFFEPDILAYSNKADSVIAKYKSYQLPSFATLHGAFYDITIFSFDDSIKEVSKKRVWQSLKYGERMNAKGIIFHTNFMPTFKDKAYEDNWVTANTEFWSEMLNAFPEANIWIENMFDLTPELLLRLCENMRDKKRFGVCFDYAHASLGITPIGEWVSALSPYIRHIHINDNDLQMDRHDALGNGQINWEEFARLYFEKMQNSSILLEMKGLNNQKISLEVLRKLGIV